MVLLGLLGVIPPITLLFSLQLWRFRGRFPWWQWMRAGPGLLRTSRLQLQKPTPYPLKLHRGDRRADLSGPGLDQLHRGLGLVGASLIAVVLLLHLLAADHQELVVGWVVALRLLEVPTASYSALLSREGAGGASWARRRWGSVYRGLRALRLLSFLRSL